METRIVIWRTLLQIGALEALVRKLCCLRKLTPLHSGAQVYTYLGVSRLFNLLPLHDDVKARAMCVYPEIDRGNDVTIRFIARFLEPL